jgi:hypothetical protein
MLDNKTLRTEYENQSYVIIVWQDGVKKYISKDYNIRGSFDFTVKIDIAKRFATLELAERFIDQYDVDNVAEIRKVIRKLYLV